MAGVVVVTDSAAMLGPETAAKHGIEVVPLQVVVAGQSYDDGTPEASPAAVTAALTSRKDVTTSRPSPAAFADVYARLAEQGAEAVVSVHLSAELSRTMESAEIAARTSPVPVVTLDMRGVGPCQGYAAIAAAHAAAGGATAEEAAAAALARADASTSYFYVDTLEYLRRGGRIGAAAALFGSALAVKPLLAVEDGKVVPHEKVRTATRALARLEELAVEAAGDRQIEVSVVHLAAPERCEALVGHLQEQLADQLAGRSVQQGDIGAVLGAHVGPGMLGVVVTPAL